MKKYTAENFYFDWNSEDLVLDIYYLDRFVISVPYESAVEYFSGFGQAPGLGGAQKVCEGCKFKKFCKRPLAGGPDPDKRKGTFKSLFCGKLSVTVRPSSKIPSEILFGIISGQVIKKLPKRFLK